MCGIAGEWAFAGRPVDRQVLVDMTRTLDHRGPDSWGVHVDESVGLGATRLAIIDVEHGQQPMVAADGELCVVQNGEIYNHRELRAELERRGRRFRTASDTEVIMAVYETHGLDFVRHLRGMFALAIWDRRRRRLVLARDRFGIKPLFYSATARGISFASELRALRRHPEFDDAVDAQALHAYLAHNSIPAPLTIHRGARKLAPGQLLVCEGGDPQLSSFARPRFAGARELRREPAAVLADELRDRLRDSVRAHLVSDVPVGVLLSGGVDSATVAALAAQESSAAVQTFSIGFEERTFDELDYARLTASRYSTDHHELVLRPDMASGLMLDIARAYDEPSGDSSALPTFMVSRLASEHLKVVLTGEGADELFGGYETYVADRLAAGPLRHLRLLKPIIDRLPSSDRRVSLEYRVKRFLAASDLPPLERHLGFKEILSAAARSQVLTPDWRQGVDVIAAHRERYAETADAPELARLQDVDMALYLVDDLLVKTDRMSMAHSLEARVPFLDSAVADLAFALPTKLKVRGTSKKRLLRQAAAAWVPKEVLSARKRGFSIPAAAWLRGPLQPFAREVLSMQVLRRQGFFDPDATKSLLDAHVAREHDHSRALWGLIAFTLWAEETRGGRQAVAPATAELVP